MRSRSLVPVLAALLLLLAGAAPASAGATGSGVAVAPAVSITGSLGPCALSGTATPGLRFQVTHRAPGGAIKGRYEVRANGGGSWTADCTGRTLSSRDRLTFRQRVGGRLAPYAFRSFTVPTLTLALDRAGGVIDGLATGVTEVQLVVSACRPLKADHCAEAFRAPMPSGGGVRIEFHRVMPGPLTGGSVVTIEWTKGEDHLVLRRQVPFVAVQLGSARVRGVGVPGEPVRVMATRGATVGKLSRTASPVTGRYAGKLLNRGADLPVAIGDIITSTSSSDPDNATFTIPKLALVVGTESVSGTCFPGDPAWLTVSPPGGVPTVQLLKPDDTGAWLATAKTDPGTRFRIDCTTDAGDVASLGAVAG